MYNKDIVLNNNIEERLIYVQIIASKDTVIYIKIVMVSNIKCGTKSQHGYHLKTCCNKSCKDNEYIYDFKGCKYTK